MQKDHTKELITFIDPTESAQYHMQFDSDLVDGKKKSVSSSAFLRFYRWDKNGAVTIGRFLSYDELIVDSVLQSKKIGFAKRPTGGGLLFHSDADLSFSLFLPRSKSCHFSKSPKENYRVLHSVIYRALMKSTQDRLQPFFDEKNEVNERIRPIYCQASCTPYDIVMNGKKIGGSACRVSQYGLLFQASIFLYSCNFEYFSHLLQDREESIESMKKNSTSIEELLHSDIPEKLTLLDDISLAFSQYITEETAYIEPVSSVEV